MRMYVWQNGSAGDKLLVDAENELQAAISGVQGPPPGRGCYVWVRPEFCAQSDLIEVRVDSSGEVSAKYSDILKRKEH